MTIIGLLDYIYVTYIMDVIVRTLFMCWHVIFIIIYKMISSICRVAGLCYVATTFNVIYNKRNE